METIRAIGVNHNQHPVSNVSLDPVEIDGLVLSTCNRTEIYYYGDSGKYSDVYEMDAFPSFRYKGRVAVRHVIEVTCGVKSLILGDRHVFHQMKQAYQSSDPKEPIHKLMRLSFQAAKRVQIKNSIPSAAAEKAENTSSALVVGAGQIASDLIQSLNCNEIEVCNRTRRHAEKLPGKTIRWKDRHDRDVDTVFVTTGAPEPIFDSEKTTARVFDLSNPPNVKGDAVRIQDLETNRSKNLPRAKRICRSKTEKFMEWYNFFEEKKPIIEKIHDSFERVRSSQFEKYYEEPMSKEDIKQLTNSIKEKFVSIPAKNLRNGVETIEDMFTLEEDE